MITAARRLKSMMTSAGVMSSQVVVISDCGASSTAVLLLPRLLLLHPARLGESASERQAVTMSEPC